MKNISPDSPCRVFIIYAREDKVYLDNLAKHLKMLEKNNIINVWCDQFIDPGERWEKAIVDNLDNAEIILILVSPDYYMSEYIQKNEISQAYKRHQNEDAIIIPIFVRHCAWQEDEIISSLQGVPENPLTEYDPNTQDKIYSKTILEKIRTLAEQVKGIRKKKQKTIEEDQRRKEQEEKRSQEEAHWSSVLKSNTIPAFKAYLSEYATGIYAHHATDFLKKLEHDETRKKEDQAWREATKTNTKEIYQLYLDHYPDGIYRNIANVRMGVSPPPSINPIKNRGFAWTWVCGAAISCFCMGILFHRQFTTSHPKQLLPPLEEEWKVVNGKGNIYHYQNFLSKYPQTAHRQEALDSLNHLRKSLITHLENANYYYNNGEKQWAKESVLKAYAIDSFNIETIEKLKELGMYIQ
jgi:TIR domain